MPALELALLFYLLSAPFSSEAHTGCETPLASDGERVIRAEPFKYQGLHMPMVRNSHHLDRIETKDSFSLRVNAPATWKQEDLQKAVQAMIHYALPGWTATVGHLNEEPVRSVAPGDLISIDLEIAKMDGANGTVRFSVTNSYDIPLLKGEMSVQIGPAFAR